MAQDFSQQHREELDQPEIGIFRKWLKFLSLSSSENEEGQGLVEYALVLLFVAIAVISILVFMGPQIGSLFSAVSKGIS